MGARKKHPFFIDFYRSCSNRKKRFYIFSFARLKVYQNDAGCDNSEYLNRMVFTRRKRGSFNHIKPSRPNRLFDIHNMGIGDGYKNDESEKQVKSGIFTCRDILLDLAVKCSNAWGTTLNWTCRWIFTSFYPRYDRQSRIWWRYQVCNRHGILDRTICYQFGSLFGMCNPDI